ncbi:rhodanese-like domain-containing protein [Paenibacillus mendelii]|uniref:Rhodanese-like domain-containing protein n=1 Tax=Paenibacillus mendelii TaxID=206163 RepID=A0ABV6JK76_9BACL|nr:rhodanese-like domain-containing protein [Paenibacillus mendelii]MCQ6557820.1 rhodanese-like domain-containing protein [Paenibacillus mendelii]
MYDEITASELETKLRNGEKLQVVDVRELDEWQDGHIAQAKHIALSEITGRLDELDKNDQPIYMVCRSGNRSGKACDFLSAQGYQVINMLGGMMSWPGEVVEGD